MRPPLTPMRSGLWPARRGIGILGRRLGEAPPRGTAGGPRRPGGRPDAGGARRGCGLLLSTSPTMAARRAGLLLASPLHGLLCHRLDHGRAYRPASRHRLRPRPWRPSRELRPRAGPSCTARRDTDADLTMQTNGGNNPMD